MVRARALGIAALIAVGLSLSACGSSSPSPSTPGTQGGETPAASAGEQLARTKCTMCHNYDRVEQASKTAEEWEATIERMVGHGLVVTAEERATITEYLAGQPE